MPMVNDRAQVDDQTTSVFRRCLRRPGCRSMKSKRKGMAQKYVSPRPGRCSRPEIGVLSVAVAESGTAMPDISWRSLVRGPIPSWCTGERRGRRPLRRSGTPHRRTSRTDGSKGPRWWIAERGLWAPRPTRRIHARTEAVRTEPVGGPRNEWGNSDLHTRRA
jgi:hypothetical protein